MGAKFSLTVLTAFFSAASLLRSRFLDIRNAAEALRDIQKTAARETTPLPKVIDFGTLITACNYERLSTK